MPCNCKKLVGVYECTEDGPSCSCPPAEECEVEEQENCFEPCGGEPFGAWVLEETCASGSWSNSSGCERITSGTVEEADIRLRILDGGRLEFKAKEYVSLSSRVSLECINVSTVNFCPLAMSFKTPLLFAPGGQWNCKGSPCGACDCEGTGNSFDERTFASWIRGEDGLTLAFPGISSHVPYCVEGDELWLGGPTADGTPRASYKFKKLSCHGKPTPCSERSLAECLEGDGCSVGVCVATTGGSPTRCAKAFSQTECGVLQGCQWDAKACGGQAPETCDFLTCEDQPGCSLGEPQQKCAGEPEPCEGRDLDQCDVPGCELRVCQPDFFDDVDCANLDSPDDCAKAPGCEVAPDGSPTPCTGTTSCVAQTNPSICDELGCLRTQYCGGTPARCETLSLEDCHSVPGCNIEW